MTDTLDDSLESLRPPSSDTPAHSFVSRTTRGFSPRLLGLLWIALAIGCNGERLELGDDDPPPVPRPTTLPACPTSVTDSRLFETDDAMQTVLEGRWFRCRGYADGLLSFEAIEFTKNGDWFALEDDGTGSLARTAVPSRYGFYSADSPIFLTIHFWGETQSQTLTLLFSRDRRALVAIRSNGSTVNSAYVSE